MFEVVIFAGAEERIFRTVHQNPTEALIQTILNAYVEVYESTEDVSDSLDEFCGYVTPTDEEFTEMLNWEFVCEAFEKKTHDLFIIVALDRMNVPEGFIRYKDD